MGGEARENVHVQASNNSEELLQYIHPRLKSLTLSFSYILCPFSLHFIISCISLTSCIFLFLAWRLRGSIGAGLVSRLQAKGRNMKGFFCDVSVAHEAFCSKGTWYSFLGIKRPDHEAKAHLCLVCNLRTAILDPPPHTFLHIVVRSLLKPTGHVMHQQFNIQQLYVLPTLYLCVGRTYSCWMLNCWCIT